MTSQIRILVYVLITIVSACIFLFVPNFNWGSTQPISMYHQFTMDGNFWFLLKRVGGLTLVVFFSLLILFGVKGKQ